MPDWQCFSMVLKSFLAIRVGRSDFGFLTNMDNFELYKDDETWKLRKWGSDRAIRSFETKEDGMKFSTDYVGEHGGSLKVKKEDGTFQEERTYPRSADPHSSPG